MSRLWWVRHAPTHNKVLAGWGDIPADLSDRSALDRLDAFLPRPAIVISSDLIRARRTADRLNAGRTRMPDDPALREFNFGAWDGLSFDAIAAHWPTLSRAYWESPGDIAPPGGESWHQAARRITAAATRLGQAHSGQDIIIASHFGAILSQYAKAAGIAPYAALGQHIAPLSVTRIDISDHIWHAAFVNILA